VDEAVGASSFAPVRGGVLFSCSLGAQVRGREKSVLQHVSLREDESGMGTGGRYPPVTASPVSP
jgi:hypothetical protein